MNPSAFTAQAYAWAGAATTVVSIIATFAVFFLGKIREVKVQLEAQTKRSDDHSNRIDAVQQQVNAVSIATPPPAPVSSPAAVPPPKA